MEKSSKFSWVIDPNSDSNEILSCCNEKASLNHDMSGVNLSTVYQCLMKCEGDKTYKTRGNCPVCHMHLASVK